MKDKTKKTSFLKIKRQAEEQYWAGLKAVDARSKEVESKEEGEVGEGEGEGEGEEKIS